MKRLLNFFLAAVLAFAPVANADLRASSGAFGSVAVTGGNVSFVQRVSLPMVRSNTGTMGNNGAYTAGTPYGKTYAKCYIYFAAAQIAAGSTAGWYYAEGSSTTAFTVYNNNPVGVPTAPASKTAFVTTGPGAITGDTTEQGLLLVVAANQLAPSGFFRMRARFTNNNTAGNKTARLRYSGLAGTQLVGQVNTTATGMYAESTTVNQSVTNAQESSAYLHTTAGGLSVTLASSAIDTTATSNPAVTTQIAVATDWMVMEWAILEVMTDGT